MPKNRLNKKKAEGKQINEILSNPAFNESMIEVQTKLQDGTSNWHSYDEVFGDRWIKKQVIKAIERLEVEGDTTK